jgi:DNA mismatch repair protein MSH4
MLKSFVQSVPHVFEALTGSTTGMLTLIRENCRPENIRPTVQLIAEVINDDVTYQKTPLDLRNQRTYAVRVSFESSALLANTDIPSVWCQWAT